MKYSCSMLVLLLLAASLTLPARVWALASNNIPLDSPIYLYLEKLTGFGLIDTDIKGLRPYSKAEAARLLLEAEGNRTRLGEETPPLVTEALQRLRELLPREVLLRTEPERAPRADYELLSAARLRYVYLDGAPRSYNRDVNDPGNQSAFGFIGGNLRPHSQGTDHKSGTEGTPLLENNEGVIYRRGSNLDLRWTMEGYLGKQVAAAVEPILLHTPSDDRFDLQKGYLKLGGAGHELELGRDANWFGPGYRGALTLTNNAQNFDLLKLSSPEPVDVGWVKKYLGGFKYALILSKFDDTGSGAEHRRPYFVGVKLAFKPKPWFEIGGNLVRQQGGPGLSGGSVSWEKQIIGGTGNDQINTIAGFDLRFRIPSLRNTEVYGEYAGEDSAGPWPIVESYVAGFYLPRLTSDGSNDLRFEYYWGSVMAYSDWQFPAGYVYHGMTPGHSQGGATQDFFLRYSHWFSLRNNLALEYFHTERGNEGRLAVNAENRIDPTGVQQAVERKNAVRAVWTLPLYSFLDLNLMYGWEHIHNVDLFAGTQRTNQLVKMDLSYRY